MAKDRFRAGAPGLVAQAARAPAAQTLRERVERGGVLSLEGVSEPARGFVLALLHELMPARTVIGVVDSLRGQEMLHQDLQTWLATGTGPAAAFYPAWDVLPGESGLPHADVISERLETLLALMKSEGGAAPVVVTAAAALLQRTFTPAVLASRTRRWVRGDRCDPLDLVEWLEAQAYEPEAQVTQKGEIALRGGILDVYPLSSPWPVRLEFFGDEIESMRFFDPQTQLSREVTDAVVLPPAGELGLLRRLVEVEPEALGTFHDYWPTDAVVVLFDLPGLVAQARQHAELAAGAGDLFVGWEQVVGALRARGNPLLVVDESAERFPLGSEEAPSSAETGVILDLPSLEAYRPVGGGGRDVPVAEQQRRAFFDQLHRWLRQGYGVHVFCNNEGERERFSEIWREMGLPEPGSEAGSGSGLSPALVPSGPAELQVNLGALGRGFLFEPARLVVVTDSEVFGRYRVPRPRRLRSPHAAAVKSALEIDFSDLEEGDYVVHLQHGIGRYAGLQRMPAGGRPAGGEEVLGRREGEECLVIEYGASEPDQPAPRLYVPVTQSHLVSKYVGAGKARPPLNTLGGTRWAKAKAQAERAVKDLAGELLAIQAARDSQPGHAFAVDTPWQREFEASFLYEETPDQIRAIDHTKRDMEQARPMDRLICGDVGFGKTEVAIRAAFKAVMDGRQVAVLVPTTVLAQQHFNTFRERMADYPVRIELLSRFRTRREQQQVLRELAAGAVDVVIGTHRLVQPDVQFRDLGLVVVDEEQRFGVLQKEQFKRLRQLVDVLTLSATPIPRTLHLALTGARDMSTIETPPQDRLPVQTLVSPYDERVIRDAIQRELGRGGQVFFLHNRVESIYGLGQRLQELVPQARLVIGHGQMPADELEEVMTRFVNGEADVLLSTTIIESGIDIPNANTIIIDRADRFGLSDLYQLRGRVGRYKHQAYAYFLLPRHATLLADARKRISAIRQYSSLGSGFKIAMRDLEIRGAGNLLGPEQSGHITAVGFELYCQLLRQSVAAAKGEKVRPRVDVAIRLDFLDTRPPGGEGLDGAGPGPGVAGETASSPPQSGPGGRACLPLSYLSEARHRIEIYRRLAQAQATEEVKALGTELRDRFGPLPGPVQRLLDIAGLRVLAADRGVTAIEVREGRLMLTRHGDFVMVGGKFPRLVKRDAKGRLAEIRKLLLSL